MRFFGGEDSAGKSADAFLDFHVFFFGGGNKMLVFFFVFFSSVSNLGTYFWPYFLLTLD